MPLVIDPTVGGASANAYLDVAGAQAILDGVPNADAWTNAVSDAVRAQALVYATSLLDALAYKGVKTTIEQALQWPRGSVLDPDYGTGGIGGGFGYMTAPGFGVYLDMNSLPKRLKRACAMLALEVLRAGPSDVWGTDPTVNVQRDKVDVLETDYIDVRLRRFGLRALPNVWREIYPLSMAAESLSVERA